MSHALRHEPALYGLELGEGGWVPLATLVTALRGQEPKLADLDEEDDFSMLEAAAKLRHEVHNGMVRALYGHAVPDHVARVGEEPPPLLYRWQADAHQVTSRETVSEEADREADAAHLQARNDGR